MNYKNRLKSNRIFHSIFIRLTKLVLVGCKKMKMKTKQKNPNYAAQLVIWKKSLLCGRATASPLLRWKIRIQEDLWRLAGGPDNEKAGEEEGLDVDLPSSAVTLYSRDENEEDEEEGGLSKEDCFEKKTVFERPGASGGLSGCNLLGFFLKLSLSMSWFSRSIGEPLDSEHSNPKCRRWARAWLERPFRVSNQAPHSWQTMSLLGTTSNAAQRQVMEHD